DEVKQLHHARRISLLVPPVAGLRWGGRCSQIDKCDGELIGLELLRGKLPQRPAHGGIDHGLKRARVQRPLPVGAEPALEREQGDDNEEPTATFHDGPHPRESRARLNPYWFLLRMANELANVGDSGKYQLERRFVELTRVKMTIPSAHG